MKIGVVTSNRADYGILVPLLRRLREDGEIDLRLLVTGTHLAEAYGHTVEEIESDGMPIAVRIPILEAGNTPRDISFTMANALHGFADWFSQNPLQMLVVLGDRTEMMGVALAAMMEHIPIAHISGGELTAGAVDDSIRHSLTKMASLHFATTEPYRKRIIQMGEMPDTVHNVGSLSAENILREELLGKGALLSGLGLPADRPLVVVTYHPVTRTSSHVDAQIDVLLSAMEARQEYFYLITKANADVGGQRINERMADYVAGKGRGHAALVASLGMKRYLSAVKCASFVLGNSSSGISEAPVLGTPTVNIGDRQQGRLLAGTIINCRTDREDILNAMDRAAIMEHRGTDMYGDGHTSEKMVRIMKEFLQSGQMSVKKPFYDIAFPLAQEETKGEGSLA